MRILSPVTWSSRSLSLLLQLTKGIAWRSKENRKPRQNVSDGILDLDLLDQDRAATLDPT